MTEADPKRALLRHTIATLAYRGAKALRGAPPDFAAFRVSASSRTPVEILAHIGDLLDWALHMARERSVWRDSTPLPWDQETARFHRGLADLDAFLAGSAPLATPAEKLFQGPVADALTHVGQINLLRRAFGAPVKGESYARATITAGQVGADQPPPSEGSEFD
jgi:hypothetical protein